jgi:hypothetical protein
MDPHRDLHSLAVCQDFWQIHNSRKWKPELRGLRLLLESLEED